MKAEAINVRLSRSIQYLTFAAIFSFLNFVVLGVVVVVFPDFFNIENSISVFVRDFGAILMTVIIMYFLQTQKFAEFVCKNHVYWGVFLFLVILFSPLWPVLALMFYPDQHFCAPNCPQVPLVLYVVLNTVGLFWGLSDASEWAIYVLFSFQMLFVVIAILIWIYGIIKLVQWRLTRQCILDANLNNQKI